MVIALYQDTLTYENMMATGKGVLQAREWEPQGAFLFDFCRPDE